MNDGVAAAAFGIAVLAFCLAWSRLLRYGDERSRLMRRSVLTVMSVSRLDHDRVKALLLAGLYYAWGGLGALVLARLYDRDVVALMSLSIDHWPLIALGIVAEVSLTNLLVDVYRRLSGDLDPARFAEIANLPWIQGLRKLPPSLVPVAAAAGGAVEEFVFRGVLLQIMILEFLIPPAAAIAIAGGLFALQQLLLVRTRFQAAVIGCACAAISLVGGLLVISTGSVAPAVLCHASFVIFFVDPDGARARTRTA